MSANNKTNASKRKAFTIEERSSILDRLAKGEKQTAIAVEYKVNRSTISNIYRRKENTLKAKELLKKSNASLKIKRYRKTEATPMESNLYKWYKQQKDAGLHITGDNIQEKARQLSEEYGIREFKGSNGWLHNFKKRWAISCHSVQKEKKKSADSVSAEEFKLELSNLINLSDINLDYIYNCGETGLFWKSLPDETLAGKDETAAARRKIKDRVTIMACTNASGNHKIPLYVIGKDETPRFFTNLQTLPVHYDHSKNALMDRYLMKYWYENIFIPEVNEKHDCDNNPNIKIQLIMENVSSHSLAEELNTLCEFCTVIILPTDVLPVVQPLDQGIIEQFKRHYRKMFLSKMYVTNSSDQIENIISRFNLLECLKYCARAWAEITPINIRKCWENLVPMENSDTLTSQEGCIDLTAFQSLLSIIPNCNSMTLQETLNYLDIDKDENGWDDSSEDQGIVKKNKDVIDEDDSFLGQSKNISLEQGLKHLSLFIKFYERQEDYSDSILQTLEDLSEHFINMIISKAIS